MQLGTRMLHTLAKSVSDPFLAVGRKQVRPQARIVGITWSDGETACLIERRCSGSSHLRDTSRARQRLGIQAVASTKTRAQTRVACLQTNIVRLVRSLVSSLPSIFWRIIISFARIPPRLPQSRRHPPVLMRLPSTKHWHRVQTPLRQK